MLLIAGKLDFFMSANTLQTFDAVTKQTCRWWRSPPCSRRIRRCCCFHPELKVTKIEDLKPLTLLVSKEGMTSYFQWLKSEYGFSESKVRPYTLQTRSLSS